MQKLWILLLCLNTFVFASTARNIYFLAGYTEENIERYEKRLDKLSGLIEDSFRVSEFNLIKKKEVNAYSLYKILKDTNTKAIFWISHGGQVLGKGSYLNLITDRYGNEVTDLFAHAHPDLEFLGIISCNSETVFSEISLAHSIQVWTSSRKISPYRGLKKAIAAFEESQNKPRESLGKNLEGKSRYSLRIHRKLEQGDYQGPIRINIGSSEVGKRFVGFLSPAIDTQENELTLDYEKDKMDVVQVIVDRENLEFFYLSNGHGDIEITDNRGNSWFVSRTKSGKIPAGSILNFKLEKR